MLLIEIHMNFTNNEIPRYIVGFKMKTLLPYSYHDVYIQFKNLHVISYLLRGACV